MKRQIRRGAFETNSSSTHAICITKDVGGYEKMDYVEFEIGEFGWETATHYDTDSKASYLITAIFSFNKDYADGNLQKLKDILNENNIGYSIPSPKVESYKYDDEIEYYYDIDGYIDHSHDTKEFVEAVLSDSDKLMRYLFGDSFVVTGNDNGYGYSERMYVREGEEVYDFGTFPRYGSLKPEFDNYEIYEKGN